MGTVKVDAKRRVVLPGARPGDTYDVQPLDDGQLLIVRLEKPEPKSKLSRAACLKAMNANPLQPTMDWKSLRRWTREP